MRHRQPDSQPVSCPRGAAPDGVWWEIQCGSWCPVLTQINSGWVEDRAVKREAITVFKENRGLSLGSSWEKFLGRNSTSFKNLG